MKPWREIAKPHQDVLRGTFQQSEFAADLIRVYKGEASPEYQDAAKFFERTYLTGGMKDLVATVAKRLSGEAGEPVVNLLTNFGGGKTHTLLAIYHLVARSGGLAKFQGIRALLEEKGLETVPQAKVAVIDGTDLSPNQPAKVDGIEIKTLWGLLAWQLLGKEGYEMVRGSDESGTAPGKAVLVDLLRRAAPCVILMDELVAFERQIVASPIILAAGSFEANTSFFQALTESVKAVDRAIVLAALPASDVEVSGEGGKAAFEMLGKVFGRVNSVWRPGSADEGFEIVKRRLFAEIRDEEGLDETCRTFSEFYAKNARVFPPEVREARYAEDLRKSYPIHPEVFERLYTDWSTLSTFQRTRGVLQYMALVIHRLWNDNHQGALIMPGDLPLADKAVQDKSVHYLPDGWPAVIDREVDGDRSEPQQIDSDTRFGAVQAAHRVARAIFLGSAASNRKSGPRGLSRERVMLGAVIPGQSPGVYSDALDKLADRLQYLFTENGRFWFDTHPNLRREMEMRRERVRDDDIDNIASDRLSAHINGKGSYLAGGIHTFVGSADVPDTIDKGPRLVILGLSHCYAPQDTRMAFSEAKDILEHHGDRPRERRNRLFFLAADFQRLGAIRTAATAYLAWHGIVDDIKNDRMMTIDLNQKKQAEDSESRSRDALDQALRDGFRWLLNPIQKDASAVDFQVERLGGGTESIAARAEKVMLDSDWIVPRWASTQLRDTLEKYYFKANESEVGLKKLWQDFATYYYLPRLVEETVLQAVVREGVRQGLFAYAAGKDRGEYIDFTFRNGGFSFNILDDGILIERSVAEAWVAAHQESGGQHVGPGGGTIGTVPDSLGLETAGAQSAEQRSAIQMPKRYYGSCKTGLDFLGKAQDIQNEILRHFAGDPNAQITVDIDITVESRTGFKQEIVRTVKENANTLAFTQSDFE